jgi:hypothetical protein
LEAKAHRYAGNRRADRWDSNLFAEVFTQNEVMPASIENMGDEGVCLIMGTEISPDELA